MTTPTPLASWSHDDSAHPELVWWAKLDDRWQIEVQRTDAYHATLCVFDHDNSDVLAHSEPVGLSYGALFGPDMGDVAHWQDKVMAYVDSVA